MQLSVNTFQANAFPQPPDLALDNFRSARILNRVSGLTPKADMFEATVHAFAEGRAALPQVIAGFSQAVKGFMDTAKAASRAGLLSIDTRSAVDSALESIVEEFEVSFRKVNDSLRDLEEANPEDAAQFLLEARERMDRLTDFWRTASAVVQRPGASPAPRM